MFLKNNLKGNKPYNTNDLRFIQYDLYPFLFPQSINSRLKETS